MTMIPKKWFSRPAFCRLLISLIRLYGRSYRVEVKNAAPWQQLLEDGQRVIMAVLHQQVIDAAAYMSAYKDFHLAVMVSQSQDGDLAAGLLSHYGLVPVRGSSSRGGKTAMRAIIEHLQTHQLAGHVVDGPRGPAGTIKAGLIEIARQSGAAIVPIHTCADRAWYLNSWDRMLIPKPFARVVITFGDPVWVEKEMTAAQFECCRQEVEKRFAWQQPGKTRSLDKFYDK